MTIWKMPISIEDLNNRMPNSAASFHGIEFVKINDDGVVAKMDISDKSRQPLGYLHGGISVFLAETVASAAANYCVDQNYSYCLGLQINANHIKSIKEGTLIAKCFAKHIGKSTQVWQTNITEESTNTLISTSTLTVAVIRRK